MNLRRVLIRGFLSYARQAELSFEPGLTFVCGRNLDHPDPLSNGSGKSSLLYAIIWALWGRVPPGGSKNDIINHQSDVAHVELELEQPGAHLHIIRSKPRKGSESVHYFYNRAKVEGDLEMVQTRLEQFYGISWAVFNNTIFLGPDSEVSRFVTAKPTERATLLAELVNSKPFEQAGERVGKELATLTKETGLLMGAIQLTEEQIARFQEDAARQATAIAQEQEHQKQVEQQAAKRIEEIQLEILRQGEIRKNKPPRGVTEIQAAMNALNAAIDVVQVDDSANAYVLRRPLPETGTLCPVCDQPISSHHAHKLAKERQEAHESSLQNQRKIANIRQQLGELQKEIMVAGQWDAHRAAAERRINDLKVEVMTVRDGVENRTLVALHRERENTLSRIKELQQLVAEKQQKVGEYNLRVPVLRILQQGFNQEIRNMLFDELRQVLAHYTSIYKLHLAGNEFEIEFPETSTTGRERFEILIKSGGVPNPLTSGGETYRATIAVLLALRRALMFGRKCPFSFLLIDDPVGQLDDPGVLAFTRLLRMLLTDYPTILVTVPRDSAAEEGRTLVVERRQRATTIKGVR